MFVPLLEPPGPPGGPALVVAVRGAMVALGDIDHAGGGLFLGTLSGRHCWAIDADGDGEPDAFTDLRALWGAVDETVWTLAGRAVQLVEWARTHRYCGRCGGLTEDVPGERARRCGACGLLAYPRLAPAVITLVERDDGRALLARGANFPVPMYSCLAGFVEPGETLEEAVCREVMEEVGIAVGDVRYRGSQPWPFPHQLMIGFSARWAGGELRPDPREIADAGWYEPTDIPSVPPPMSIARRLIDGWRARAGVAV